VTPGLRPAGHGADDAATGCTATDGAAWGVLPTAVRLDPAASMVLFNGGASKVRAAVTLLPDGGGSVGDTIQLSVPAGQTAAVPRSFLAKDHTAAALVGAGGPIIALGAGTAGSGRYAMALGVPVPSSALPNAP